MRRRYTAAIAASLLLLMSEGSLGGESHSFGEYELKAGFIYKFISFVSWPEPHDDSGTVTIAILGKNPFGDAFKAVEGTIVNGRVVKIKFFGSGAKYEDLKSCQLVYICSSEEKKLSAIFKAIGKQPVLTIGDSKGFVDKGGMIGFVEKQKKRIGIEMNNGAVSNANLTVRSMLKRIAVRIVDTPDSKKEESREDSKK
jgi:hypothetical protein